MAKPADVSLTDGNYWETQNIYTVLIYYKSFSDRCEQLVGIANLDSRNYKNGF